MKEQNDEETFFREIMSKSKLTLPFSDFEDKVMMLIERKHSRKDSISKDLKLSWLFFIVGATFGIFISIVLPTIQESFFGVPINKFAIPFQVIFIFLLVNQLDNFLSYIKKHSRKF